MKTGFLPETMRRFCRDQRGNVLMLFGIALIPMMGVVGVAIDYSRATNTRQALNSAIDTAALMAARDAQKLTDAQIRDRIDKWIRDNLPREAKEEYKGAVVTIDRTARTIQIAANAEVQTTISRVIGTSELAVGSTSQATWGTNKIELALVLDNTGSMSSSGKMTALKQASKDLVKIMKDASIDPDQIKISIVPFNTQVRADRGLKNESWINYAVSRNVTCDKDTKNCKWRNPATNKDVSITDTSNLVCTNNGKTCTETMTKAVWSSAAQGCFMDREKNYDTTDGGAYSSIDQQYPAFWCSQSSLAEIKPLTNDWDALNTHIDTMTPVGNTNVTIGAVWGWATLTPQAPFTSAKPKTEPRLKKYMILLTDGENTENRFTSSGSEIDKRTKLACTNIKADGISLYTIRVIDGNATLLKDCASAPEMYYDVKKASELGPVFQAIANEISAVRLTL
ncbi:pilus assembly protein [Bosea sp. (in: a-proteobacteria)]|uniref:TadE/TadG family type IV pilus assembly protein n=1 Tax=Bosea sp. (in: a-proteobacteria) TaxID=1871050 RepID=UPI00261B0351|nr:pilus assembly protein [Bosea sp. (in: a-proteobacteria)]MCO5091536.1 pilus assembly protein TadG-related protein [Bosea sp. (in: a-proteobacteria)]